MTRGKHGASAAIRRAEAAHEHIDRLTDQLVEAKARARRYEATALRVEAMEVELRRLRQQVEDRSSDALEKSEKARSSLRAEYEFRLEGLAGLLGVLWNEMQEEGTPLKLNGPEWDALAKFLGKQAWDVFGEARGWRREEARLFRRRRHTRVKSGEAADRVVSADYLSAALGMFRSELSDGA